MRIVIVLVVVLVLAAGSGGNRLGGTFGFFSGQSGFYRFIGASGNR
jgi:hypothetical protein